MTGALLRSGKISSFKALGKTGQPVYRAALQLRNAIQRKNKLDALCLAIPQTDQQGDNIDWYSPVPGDVIPWSSATDTERVAASIRLEEMKSRLIIMRNELQASKKDNAESRSKDKQVFEQLLEYVIRFPDPEFIYLVRAAESDQQLSQDEVAARSPNVIPVLTFWGFLHADDVLSADPLYCLYPPKPIVQPVIPQAIVPAVVAPVAAAIAPKVAPAITPVTPVTPRLEAIPAVIKTPWWKNWRRWLWLLLALLLLLLILFLLRGCGPSLPSLGKLGSPSMPAMSSAPKMPAMSSVSGSLPNMPSMPSLLSGSLPSMPNMPSLANGSLPSMPDLNMPDMNLSELNMPSLNMPDLSLPELNMVTDGEATPALAGAEASSLLAEAADTPTNNNELAEPPSITPPTLPAELAEPPAVTPTNESEEDLVSTKPAGPTPSTPPAANTPAAPNTDLDFLNGNWQAQGGIQDQRTGKPLRLAYQFNDGQGDATVRRADGVSCTGPVSAAMNNGNLAINSQGQAKCGDGGVYDMPAVSCKPDAQNMADCTGSYGNEFFPMTMRNAGE